MQEYLTATEIIDWQEPAVLQLAQQLATSDIYNTAKACFTWVRDNIYHSSDYQMNPVTCRASSVLHHKTGYCFAKSHLLAALLRANSIPTGFCYQRLSVFDNGAPYSLHGFNGIYLPDYGWYRCGQATFRPDAAEIDCSHIFAEPLPMVVKALQTYQTWDEALHNLPDVECDYLAAFNQKPPYPSSKISRQT